MAHTRAARRHGPREAGPRVRRLVAGKPARAGTLAKTPLNSRQTNPQSMSLFLERATMQRNPRKLPPLQRHGPRSPACAANFTKTPLR